MKSRIVLFFLAFILFIQPLCAQTAAKLEALFETSELTWEQTVAFVLEAADLGIQNPEESFRFAMERKWLPKKVSPDDAARLNGIALLLMQSFELKGGIFYRISKSRHHAYRELVYKNVIHNSTDPDMLVSGPQLLLIISRVLTIKEQS